jgi:hypothetical protein
MTERRAYWAFVEFVARAVNLRDADLGRGALRSAESARRIPAPGRRADEPLANTRNPCKL